MRNSYLAVLLLAGVLSACQVRDSRDAALTPTGYSSEEVQRITVYYDGALYWYTAGGFDQPLEVGFEKVGEVGKVDNQEYPKEELCGTRLETGQEVYASPKDFSKIYVKYGSGYAAFERQGAVSEAVIPNEHAEPEEDTETEPENLPPITADAALIRPASISFPIKRTEHDVEVLADLNHDGNAERVIVGLEEYAESSGMECGKLKVVDGTSKDEPVLWEQEYGTSHVGWSMVYLYQEEGKDYLVKYSPYMNTGLAAFQLSVFSLDDQGAPVIFKSYEADFSLTRPDTDRDGFYGDTQKLTAFLEQAEHYLSRSLLLVSTDEGKLAYSTPEAPITLQHDHKDWCGRWNVIRGEDALGAFQLAVKKNWLETEGIPVLCGVAEGWQTYDIDVSRKGIGHENAESDDMMQKLFGVLSEDNWSYLPEKKMPSCSPDVLITISRIPMCDVYISCFVEEELAVIWSAPFVSDVDNHMESICECYQLSKEAIEKLIRWEN